MRPQSAKRIRAFLIAVLVLAACALMPARAEAAQDIVLGVFFSGSEDNATDTIYASYDGVNMYRIAIPYKPVNYDARGGKHYSHSCPSIMYHNGYFWMLSNWRKNDGKFWPMISYSKDLIHWTHPEGEGLINQGKWSGISLAQKPSCGYTDIVAPEWFKSSDGRVFIVFSAGQYGAWHGNATYDQMESYIVEITTLSAKDGYEDGSTGFLWPNSLTVKAGSAQRASFTKGSSSNYIDGSVYEENGSYYLIIKKDGLTNQIYKSGNISNVGSWTKVNGNAVYGYEGPSVAKLGGTYYMYADHVTGATADGVCLYTASSITGSWSKKSVSFYKAPGTPRHGSVITLKSGTAEWNIVKYLLDGAMAGIGVWKQDSVGWWYRHSNGTYTKNDWEKIDGKWYLFDSAGYMRTGWAKVGKNWYWLEPSGEMKTGWKQISGRWYYLNTDGSMATGWKKVGSIWYLLKSSGAMLTGWQQVGASWYYLDSNGVMYANRWRGNYYLGSDGAMLVSTRTPDGYRVDANGKWIP